MAPSVVIVGVSTRALAESAVRAGWRCRTVDAFGDLDQREMVPNVSLRRDLGRRYGAAAAVALACRETADAAAYTANLENHPAAVRRLARGCRLLGNGPETLAQVRDPRALACVVWRAGGCFPVTLPAGQLPSAPGAWLRKPVRGGGGSGVARWERGAVLGRGEMLQERIEGELISWSFAADGQRAALLGVARQLAGDAAFRASGFRYCGSVLLPTAALDPARLEQMQRLADAVTAAFGLRGVNGIDAVLRGEDLYVLECNPRPTASMELTERAGGLSVWDTHVRACGGALPDPAALPPEAWGKAVVYARRTLVLGDTRPWLLRDDVRDVPFPGERIRRGHPVCTIFARALDAAACHALLVRRAAALQREIDAGSADGG